MSERKACIRLPSMTQRDTKLVIDFSDKTFTSKIMYNNADPNVGWAYLSTK